MKKTLDWIGLTLFRLGEGAFDATHDLNPLLLTNDCVYSVPTSFTREQFGVVRFWSTVNYPDAMATELWSPSQVIFGPFVFSFQFLVLVSFE